MIEIRVPARVHVGLIEVSGKGYRTNGGVGWALDSPELVVRASKATRTSVEDRRTSPLLAYELAELESELDAIAIGESLERARICITGNLPTHRGLGGGTALRLAAIECLMILACRTVFPVDLVRLSGRGGTSGIGVRTYFDGGLVFDLGHAGATAPQPSRDRTSHGRALAVLRLDFPPWEVGLLVCPWLRTIPIEEERQLFARCADIAPLESRDILYHMTFGIIAAVAERDPDTFATAVDAVQVGAWKRAEWACHGEELKNAADALRAAGARGVGLSSVGPALFFLASALDLSALPPSLAANVRITKPDNRGRIVRVVNDG